MRALDTIIRKRDGETLSAEEIRTFIADYTAGSIPDYQTAAWLMAVFFRGMTPAETSGLTLAMIDSGDLIDLSGIPGPFVDKHSTGGVGDKVSLILAPVCAACGVRIPMMSGRSLGHTGGTLDKLESIPGYTTSLEPERFASIIAECGYAMTGQSERIVPADRLLYALRDATGTVESIPLITGSILSKKFAEGARALVFDIKTGSGAFMKTLESARNLAHSLALTARELDRPVVAVLTRMDEPLGTMVGNFVEVEESIACLDPADPPWSARRNESGVLVFDGPSGALMEVTVRLSARMLTASGIVEDAAGGLAEAEDRVLDALRTGGALRSFERNVALQGGDIAETRRRIGTWRAPVEGRVDAPGDGFVSGLDAYAVGMAAVRLGAGRSKTSDRVLPDVGVQILRPAGSAVRKGDPVLRFWAADTEAAAGARALLESALAVGENPGPRPESMIIEEIRTQ